MAGHHPAEGGVKTNQPFLEQREPLLRTKLFTPSSRKTRVVRTNLIEKLNAGLDKALILVSAPAGFGKTTLVTEWAAQAALPVAWLSLDAGDNDPYRFLNYIIAALQSARFDGAENLGLAAQSMLQSIQPFPVNTILVTLLNELVDCSESFVLVLDDYQFITSHVVNEALAFILEQLPVHVHLVIASRADPPLPLHRLRAAQLLLEVRTADLRFNEAETRDFMNRVMALNLPQEDITSLNARTEGWIAGLQMTAISLIGSQDPQAFIRSFSGSHRYILEYLLEEVLNRQPETLRSFLLQTSILERLCAPLCDALVEEKEDSQAVLQYMERSNLFLTPLDEVGGWFRYHHLFSDLLQVRLQRSQPELLPVLHLRASRWYEKEGLPQDAIKHALAGNDPERAAQLTEQHGIEILSQGEMAALIRLIENLPEAMVYNYPELCVLYAWALTLSGRLDEVESWHNEVEKRIRLDTEYPKAREILGSIAINRGLIADLRGDMDSAIELAIRADELLPKENLLPRSVIPFVLGDGYFLTGELDKAEEAFEKIKEIGYKSGNLWTLAVALHKQALVKKLRGKLHAARDLYQEAIWMAREKGAQQYGSLAAIFVGLGDLLREWNELEAARQMVSRGIQYMENWLSPTDQMNGYLTLARISISEGDLESAVVALQKAEEVGRRGNPFPNTRINLEACQVRLWLVQGDTTAISRWLEEKQFDEKTLADRRLDYLSEIEWISKVRVTLAAKEWERALHLSTFLAESAEAAGRNGSLVEILNLSALAHYRSGNIGKAVESLKKSLELAEPEGFVRVFLDEGSPMEALIRETGARVEGTTKAYAEKLLDAFELLHAEVVSPAAPPHPDHLVEPLTGREIEVLGLIASGLTNQQIAERLVLSEGTVKTHTHNLYGKLGVISRTQAIARAKELHLM